MARNKLITTANTEVLMNITFGQLLNGWILMLLVGAIGHRQGLGFLFLDYWTCVLVTTVAELLFSPGSTIAPYLRAILRANTEEATNATTT